MTDATETKVLIYASNLRGGGGVQVAASLVDELSRLATDDEILDRYRWLGRGTSYEVSPEVRANLKVKIPPHIGLSVTTSHWTQLNLWNPFSLKNYDLQFVVFGPRYGFRRARTIISGIADGTSVYQWPKGVAKEKLQQSLKRKVRGAISRKVFSNEDFLVAESASLLDAFCKRTGYNRSRASIIPNVINRAVLDDGLQEYLSIDLERMRQGTVLLAYVARWYPHKNHEFLPSIHKELRDLGVDSKFVLTLSEDEWGRASSELRAVSINAGVLPISQVADLYTRCDAVIFPSLLESFSATPMEALATNGLLFASDRDFVRDVCGDAPVYFDPLDAKACASTLYETLMDHEAILESREKAKSVVANLPTARDRALLTLECIQSVLSQGEDC